MQSGFILAFETFGIQALGVVPLVIVIAILLRR